MKFFIGIIFDKKLSNMLFTKAEIARFNISLEENNILHKTILKNIFKILTLYEIIYTPYEGSKLLGEHIAHFNINYLTIFSALTTSPTHLEYL